MTLSLANLLYPSRQDRMLHLERVILYSQDIAKALIIGEDVDNGNITVDHPLVNSLLAIRDQIKNAQRDNKAWIIESLMSFSEIFNMAISVHERYQLIINALVKYLKGNYAVLYISSDDERFVEARAAYGMDRKAYPIFEKGEGLVGQCFRDQELVELKTPSNFIRISSGLGSSSPSYILLAPLIFLNKVAGVIEIASFSEFSSAHKELLLKVSQSIAGFVVNTKSIDNTNRLLSEIEAMNKLTENKLKQQDEIHQKIISRLKEKINQTKQIPVNNLN